MEVGKEQICELPLSWVIVNKGRTDHMLQQRVLLRTGLVCVHIMLYIHICKMLYLYMGSSFKSQNVRSLSG